VEEYLRELERQVTAAGIDLREPSADKSEPANSLMKARIRAGLCAFTGNLPFEGGKMLCGGYASNRPTEEWVCKSCDEDIERKKKARVDREDFRQAQQRIRGPLWAAQEYLGFSSVQKSLVSCDEGQALLEKAQADLVAATNSTSLLLAYAARMNGFED
jgi:hypothetical protein